MRGILSHLLFPQIQKPLFVFLLDLLVKVIVVSHPLI